MDDLKYQREVSSVKFHPVIKEICFDCFDALRPSQQFFQTYCSMPQYSGSAGGDW